MGRTSGRDVSWGLVLSLIAGVASGQCHQQWCRDSSEGPPLEEPALPGYFGTASLMPGLGEP